MGWLVEDGRDDAYDHEGFVELLVKPYGEWRWRAMGLDDPRETIDYVELASPAYRDGDRSFRIRVACECGWRSNRMIVPIGASWAPCSIFLSEDDEDIAAEIWQREHRDRLDHVAGFLKRPTEAVPS